jgi:hypothetical protein
MDHPDDDELTRKIRTLLSALEADRIAFEEITDLEGREGMTDAEFAEQVIALAHQRREALRAAFQ